MKKIFTFLALLAWYANFSQTCLPEGINFSSQTQIDDFPSDYPGCTQILGNVTIRDIVSGNITNLNSLSELTSIGGYLWVSHNADLSCFSGLDNLTSIGGFLYVRYNGALTSLSALANVTSVGGDLLSVCDNAALTSLSGLDNVTYIGGDLVVWHNDALTSLSGLDNITSIGGNLGVYGNSALTSLSGLGKVTSIGGDLVVAFNASLPSLNGLDNVASIRGCLVVGYNASLISSTALGNIDYSTITNLILQNSANLSICDAKSICDYLDNGGSATISGNAKGCNSVPEVQAACTIAYR